MGAATPTKSLSWTATTPVDRLRGAEVDRDELRAVRGPAEDLAVEHPRPGDVRRVGVRAGHHVAAVGPGDRGAEDLPPVDRRELDVGRDRRGERPERRPRPTARSA